MVPAVDKGSPIHVVYTGVVPIVYKAQRTLLTSLIDSIGWAFVMIALVMMVLVASGPVTLEPAERPRRHDLDDPQRVSDRADLRHDGTCPHLGGHRNHDDRQRGDGGGRG
jgi:hypothetical protein